MFTIINKFYKIIFILNTFNIIFVEYIKYLFKKDYNCFVINISDKLSKKNLFYGKILQTISTNNDFFTPEINNYLLKYTNQVDFSEKDYNINHIIDTFNLINNNSTDYKIDVNNLIQINSGIISVVFKGKMEKKILNDNSEYEIVKQDIVIKLLRNDIEKYVNDSFENINYLINILYIIIPSIKYINIKNIINESKESIILQIDFENEVNNIRKFKNKNKKNDYIIVPEPYEIFTKYNKNIVVMDYIEGREINKINENEKKIYLTQLASFGIKCILYDGLYHCDIHPGNILFIDDKKNNYYGNENDYINDKFNGLKIGIIDYGIIGNITEEEQILYFNFFKLMFEKNFNELSRIILNVFTEPIDNNTNYLFNDEKLYLINRLEKIAINTITKNKSFHPKDIYNINKLLYRFDLRLCKKFSNILLSIAISDSVSKQLETNIKYIDCIEQSIQEIMKSIKI